MSQHVRYGAAGWVGFGALTLGNIVATTMLIWLAAQGESVLLVFPFCVANWGCYLLSHYLVEGEFIDESDTSHDKATDDTGDTAFVPESRTNQTLSVVGIGGMFMTFPTGIVAVNDGNLWLLLVSATLFVGGYIVGHQGLTQKLL